MSRRFNILIGGVILAAAIPAMASKSAVTSERYGFSTFREKQGNVALLVDGYPASLHASDPFIPVPVVVANTDEGKAVPLTTESFTLVDAQGHAVPAAGYEELVREYDKLSFDRSLMRLRPLVIGDSYSTFTRQNGSFYPAPGKRVRFDHAEVPAFSYYTDVLYFPMPPSGLDGVLTLRLATPGRETVSVKFVASEEGFETR